MSDFNLQLPSDFDAKLNKNILLTGAGFSKDFGALLADEISTRLFNSKEITSSIKNKIAHSKNSNYEEIYNLITDEEKDIYEGLLLAIFKEIDLAMQSKVRKSNIEYLIKLFYRVDCYNFIFTLNQDLLIERYCLDQGAKNQGQFKTNEEIKENLDSIISSSFPYTNYSLPDVVKHKNNGNDSILGVGNYSFDDFIQVIKFEKDSYPRLGFNSYFKIHGSSNWGHSEGSNMLITGKNKQQFLVKFKVLECSLAVFERVLNTADLKIVIIGYSFTDLHINRILLGAIKMNAKLFIIDPRKFDDFKKLEIDFSDGGDDVMSVFIDAIENYFPLTLAEFLLKKDGYLDTLRQQLS